jgi:trigger factor
LNIQREDLPDRQLKLTVEIPAEQLEGARRTAARKLAERTRIPGFRPGKAPYEMIVRKLGDEAVFEEALEIVGQQTYREALEHESIDPYAPGSLDEVVSREPLVLRYTVPLSPEVDLGTYRELRIAQDKPAVKDEAVEAFMEELRTRQAVIEPAARAAALGDLVVLDAHGTIEEAGGHTDLMDEHGITLLLQEETNWPFTGIAAHLVGLSAGEDKHVAYRFPDDYTTQDLRGKTAHFSFHVNEVKSRSLPEWSDDVARGLGGFENLDDLRGKVRQSLQEQADRKAESDFAAQVVERVVQTASLTFPPILVQEETDSMLQDLDRRLQSQKLSLADYLRIEKKTLEEVRKDLEPPARQRVQRALVLGKVVGVEGLDAAPEEIEAQFEVMARAFGATSDDIRRALDNPAGRRRIALDLLTEKAITRLVAIARGEAPENAPPAPESSGAAPGEAPADPPANA